MTFIIFAILLGQLGIGALVFTALRDVLRIQEEEKRQRMADSMAILRIEHAAEAIVRVIQTESDLTRGHTEDRVKKVDARLDALTEAMRTVVHETPDFAITGEDGEVPIRRMRSLRTQLAIMEERSRVAAGE